MNNVTLSATPQGNGYQATVVFPGNDTVPGGIAISSRETYPTIAEAISAAALKLLEMPDRLEQMDLAAPRTDSHISVGSHE